MIAARVATGRHAALEVGEVRSGEVGAAAKKFRQQGRDRIERVLAGLAGGDGIGFGSARLGVAVTSVSLSVDAAEPVVSPLSAIEA